MVIVMRIMTVLWPVQDGTVAAAAVTVPSPPNEETKSRLEDDINLDHIGAAPVLVEARGGYWIMLHHKQTFWGAAVAVPGRR
jgi:hypothetical protein